MALGLTVSVGGGARAELSLEIDIGPDPARSGSPVEPNAGPEIDVRIEVANRGDFVIPNVTVVVPIPESLQTISRPSIIGGSCDSIVGNVNNCDAPETISFPVGDLAPGKGRTVGFSAFAKELAEGEVVTIRARAQVQGDTVIAERSFVVRDAPAFEIALAPDRNPAAAGEELTYTVTWGHVATTRLAPNAMIELALPNGTTFVEASAGGTVVANVVTWSLGDLGPGRSGRERVTVRVDDAVPGALLRAEAEIFDDANTPEIARASATVRVESDITLEVDLTIGPDPIRSGPATSPTLGRELDVRVRVANSGAFLLPAVVIEVPLSARLATLLRPGILGGTCDSIVGNVNNCDFPERARFEIGDLPAGSGRTVGFSVLLPELADASIIGVEAFASAGASGQHIVIERHVVARSEPAFELALTTDREPVGAREALTYTLTWGHVAVARAAPATRLELALPAGTTLLSATSGGELDASGRIVAWNLGELGPGASGEERVTVVVEDENEVVQEGSILRARATIYDDAELREVARAPRATRVQSGASLELALDLGPAPLRSGPLTTDVRGRPLDV
ncbi:MAG TPA: hypothetical protein VK116_10655, partial [Planctomycetota bacterium]|nr:hypothetical protein [Planctomycetota bacterium]